MALGVSQVLGLGSAAAGALQAGISAFGMQKAKKQAFQAVDAIPTYTEDPEVKKMLEMRRARLGMGLGAAAKQTAEQGIASSAAQATTAAQQMRPGSGLAAIGAIQKQSQRGATQVAGMEEQAREKNLLGFERAVGEAGAERQRRMASEKEKAQTKANIRLEQLAAKKAAVQQGLNAFASGLTTAATAGMGGEEGLAGMFKKKANFGGLTKAARSKSVLPFEQGYGPQ